MLRTSTPTPKQKQKLKQKQQKQITIIKRQFHPTKAPQRFTRLIDASLSLKNQHAKNKAKENIEQIKATLKRDQIDNPAFNEFLNDSQAKSERHKARIERKMRSKDAQHPFSAYNFNITIIGRPNVGKSSLFNRLTGEQVSMVHNSSGVTRDWNHAAGSIANLDFQIIDTAGLEEALIANQSNPNRENDVAFGNAKDASERSGTSPLITHKNKKGKTRLTIPKSERTSNYALGRPLTKELQESMLQLTSNAIKNSDIVIFMIDAKQGVTPQDEFFATWLRKQLHTNTNNMNTDLNISTFNKYYTLLQQEIDNDKDGKYKQDPTQLPLERLLKEAKIENIDEILAGAHTDRQFLRSIHTKPVIVLANKYDYGNLQNAPGLNNRLNQQGMGGTVEDILIKDFDLLGFDDPVLFSSIHGIGLGELYSKMVFSMSKVLKQWDVYQRKVKFIQKVHLDYDNAIEQQKIIQVQKEKELGRLKHQQLLQQHQKQQLKNEKLKEKLLHGENDNEIMNSHDEYDNLSDLDHQSQAYDENNDLDHIDDNESIMPQVDSTNPGKDKKHQVKFVVCGRPNAGKSTLINSLLGEKRVLTGPQPGITRDSIKLDYNDPKFPNHNFQLIDTAGLKGITQHQHSRYDLVDSTAMQSTLKNIQKANVVALVVDIANGLYGTQGIDPVFTAQIQKNFIENVQQSRFDSVYEQAKAKGASDEQLAILKRKHSAEKSAYDDKLTMLVSRVSGCVTKHEMDIARIVADHGKGLLVIANKIDRLKGGQDEIQSVMKGLLALFSMTYAQNKGVTILPVSALHATNTNQIMRKVAQLYDRWDNRIGTGVLNRWLSALMQLSPPPKVGTTTFQLKYITQTNTRPPTFALFVNKKQDFPISYERFVRNSLINEFHLQGIPVRLNIRSGANPYVSNQPLTSSEKFQKMKRRQREEIMKIRQARSGKHNKALHSKIAYKGFKPGTASQRHDPQMIERVLDHDFPTQQDM